MAKRTGTRGYPRTVFDIIDQTQIPALPVEYAYNHIAIAMSAFTSDKGPENWRMITNLTDFTNTYGGINFERHGQAQLIVAEMLRRGGYVFGKRMVSSNATLANVTIRTRVVVSDGVAYLYTYAVSAINAGNTDVAAEVGYNEYDYTDEEAMDFPLFTITALGRGESNIFFRIVPAYSTSKASSCLKYNVEIIEDGVIIESIVCTLNPEYIIDNQSQAIQAKLNGNSVQVSCKMFDDGIYGLARLLSQYATLGGAPLTVSELLNHDYLNGMHRRGSTALGGVIAAAASDDATDEWTANLPSDIVSPYHLDDASGIPLASGSYGTLGTSPMENQAEYTLLLLGAWGKNQTSEQFDPIIYDLDSFKPDAVFDSNYPTTVKNAIIDVADFRGDIMFFADLGMSRQYLSDIIEYSETLNRSRFCAMYHNYFNIINPYSKKQITVTMPYLLASRFVKHVDNGVGRPFAGIANGLTFPEIITGSVNFMPVVIPGLDQKQQLADACVNYINYYDGVPVMETMYVNYEEYTQLSFLHNMLAIQEVIKAVRSHCPRVRYTFLDGDDLEEYLEDARTVLNQFQSNFRQLEIEYMYDEIYEQNNIFYATITVRFHNFIQEEYFKIYAIS